MTETIQRWSSVDSDNGAEMWSDEDGDYVLHDDHLAAIAKLETVLSVIPGYLDRANNAEFRSRQLEIENADLRAKVAREILALQWRPITETDLPCIDSEVIDEDGEVGKVHADNLSGFMANSWLEFGFTHFRPINPPESHDADRS